MRCDFEYCIYNENYCCLLKNIEIDALGMCEDCILVSVPETELKKMKIRQLEDIVKRNK